MNFQLYLYLARRWVVFAVLPAMLVGLLTFLYVGREAKQYETSATLYVQQPSTDAASAGSTDVYQSQMVIPTYSQMITSPVVMQGADKRIAARYPNYHVEAHALRIVAAGSSSLTGVNNTQLMTITLTDSVPDRAAYAVNMVASTFINQVTAIQKERFQGGAEAIQRQLNMAQANIQDVSQRMSDPKTSPSMLGNLRAQLQAYQSIYQTLLASSQEFNVNRSTALHSVRIFSPAEVPTAPIGPHPSRTALSAALFALFVCVAGIFLYDYFDDTAKTPEDVEEVVNAPILGTVQQFDPQKAGTQLVAAKNARGPLAEAYRVARTNLEFSTPDNPAHVIMVTSASPAEGKSTTAANLAYVFAEAGKKVVLVDADLRRPSLHRVFQVDREHGLTNMLISHEELNGYGTNAAGLDTLTLVASGPVPPRPADLLASAKMQQIVEHLRNTSDLVIIDSPPILAVTDAAILSTVVDGVVLVVDPSKTRRRELKRAREAVEDVGGKVLGVVINRLNKKGSTYYYYYYHHNYGYQYRYDYSSSKNQNRQLVETKS